LELIADGEEGLHRDAVRDVQADPDARVVRRAERRLEGVQPVRRRVAEVDPVHRARRGRASALADEDAVPLVAEERAAPHGDARAREHVEAVPPVLPKETSPVIELEWCPTVTVFSIQTPARTLPFVSTVPTPVLALVTDPTIVTLPDPSTRMPCAVFPLNVVAVVLFGMTNASPAVISRP
jgi:hypothetical protein